MECIVVRSKSSVNIRSPGSVLSTGEMAAVDTRLECFLIELCCVIHPRVFVPAITASLANVRTLIAVDVCGREPSGSALLVHVDAVIEVGQLKRIAVLLILL